MPHAEPVRFVQHKDQHRAGGSENVAGQHGFLLVKPVCYRAGENAHEHIGRIAADAQHRRAEGGAGLFIQPQRQRKRGHGASKLRKALRAPQQIKVSQPDRIVIHFSLLLHHS